MNDLAVAGTGSHVPDSRQQALRLSDTGQAIAAIVACLIAMPFFPDTIAFVHDTEINFNMPRRQNDFFFHRRRDCDRRLLRLWLLRRSSSSDEL